MTSIPPTATYSSFLVPTLGCRGRDSVRRGRRALPGRRGGFPWRPFAVPRLDSSELVSWTTAATPALQPGTSWPLDTLAVTTTSTNAQSWTGSHHGRPAVACAVRDAATLRRLGLASDRKLEAYEGVFHRADATAYPALMDAQDAA